ncbi:uncharacterized protein JCM6883_002192 [Sporobolomyces salmoneus]|uniref:uncharacterized protein n=1 Tax=Sporobolomyces salmoneus TaxID=183962 RepID=UPI00318219EC
MSSDLAYRFNPNVANSAAPPVPLAAQWASLYPTPSELLNLAQGVPGSPPPPEFLERLGEAARDPSTTGYGALRGEESLRRALAKDVQRVYGGDVSMEDVTITAGCNLAFYATMLTLCAPGDSVLVPTPYYFNHHMTLSQLSLSLIPLPCHAPHFLPSVDLARSLITSRTKAIVLVTPNNPTGALYPRELLKEFAELAKEKKVALVLDETYRDFVDGRPHDLFVDPEWREYLIQLFSFSKSYAIPGHRLGSLTSSPLFASHLSKTLDCLQICPSLPAQRVLAEWAMEETREWREGTRVELERRQKVFREGLERVEGWEVETGMGYFAYVKHPFEGTSSEEVAKRLASEVGVITLPGTFFSMPFVDVREDRFIRFSIANVSTEILRQVPERLKKLNEIWSTLS